MSTRAIALTQHQHGWLRNITLLAILSVCWAAMAAAADVSADSTTAKSWVNIPGGLAEATGKVAYVASASDGIEAIDLESGQAIWESKEAQRPLALAGDQVIAQAPRGQSKINTITVVILDAPSGKVVTHAQPIVLPDWIAVDGGIGLSFASIATIEGNELVLTWHAERQFAKGVTFAGGVPPTQEAIAAARKIESGQARVDLARGSASVTVDRFPQTFKLPRALPYYDVGDKRLSLIESPENLPGGIRIVHCLLDARNEQTGRPMWKHEIAGEIILPDVPPTAQRMPSGDQSPRR